MRDSIGVGRCSIRLLLAIVLLCAIPAVADSAVEGGTSGEPVGLWALCPCFRGGYPDIESTYPRGIYLLTGAKKGRVPEIYSCENRLRFPDERQDAHWIGNVPGSRYVVMIGTWDWAPDFVYTVIDKQDPLNVRKGPPGGGMYDFWGFIDGKWQVMCLAAGEKQTDPLVVQVFDPGTLTVSEPGHQAWQHVFHEDSLKVTQEHLVFDRRLGGEVHFPTQIPEEYLVEGKGFGLYWNDSVRAILRTSDPSNPAGLTLICVDKKSERARCYDLDSRPAGFRVMWPWVLCGYVDEKMTGTTPRDGLSNPAVRYWRVLNLESEKWGHFSLEVRSDNNGLDILDDVVFWVIEDELLAVDLREAVAEGTTTPHLVWRDPLVPCIRALFPAPDSGETEPEGER